MIDETEVIRNEKKSDTIIKNTSIIWNRLGETIEKSKLMEQSALKITVIYMLIGSGWILFSDKILSMLSNDPKWIFTFSVLKGWIFVMLTGGILYWLVAHSHKSLQQKNLALTISNERRLASEEELRQQVDELLERDKKIMQQNLVLTSLHNTVFSLMNRLDLNELLKTIVCNAAKLMNTLHVYICLCDESKGTYTRIIGTGVYQKNQGEILPVTQGLTGHVYQVGRLTIIDDYSLWEKRLLDSEFDSMHCTLQVPFLSEAKVVGVLGVSFDDPKRKFTEEEVHLVTRFSELASIALDNATSFTMKNEEKMKLQALIDIIPDIMFRIKRDGTFIGCKADDKVLYIPSDQLLGKKVLEVLPLGIGKEIMLNIENALNHEQLQIFEYELPVQGELHYYEARIIKSGTDEVVAIIRNISERKQMEEKLEYLSLHDSMTGLYNRAYFEVEMERIQEGGNGQVGIIICDLDGLKVINDTLGHSVGDEILKAVAGVLKKAFHPSDLVARIGGDEFAVILPSNSVSIFTSACRRIREMTEEWNLKNPLVPISLSIGFAVGKEMPADVNALFKAADNYMYREKLHRHQSSKNAIVQALISALEARDFITEGHGDRLRDLVASLAIVAGLPESSIADLRLLAQFHDIGKVGIPDNILFKPGRLTKEEFDIMQGHCEIGYRIAKSTSDLEPIADWILKHHEWWDGTGYPFGIKGEAIPIECRILSIVDSYDAMTNDRPYREAMSKEKAMAELRKCAGSQFDPHLVGLFIEQIRQ